MQGVQCRPGTVWKCIVSESYLLLTTAADYTCVKDLWVKEIPLRNNKNYKQMFISKYEKNFFHKSKRRNNKRKN